MRTVTKAKKNKKPVPKLLQLFLSCLYISAFTFGGGFVIVTFMKKKFVDQLHWIDDEEMLDLAALAQSGPGAIAVNAAIMVGWRIDGFIGMLVAVLGTIIPPMVILSVISLFYKAFASNRYVALVLRGMQSGVAAVIFDVVVGLGQNVIDTRNVVYYLVMAAAFAASVVLKVNVIYIILAAAALGLVLALIEKKTGKTVGQLPKRKEEQK
ncbi:MAG TPA: chromate transporter [Lachnospiraceae bacterium]|jgi:chromate transporter|nr:chromate transporter [Lachnospiraceae bacterium]